MSMDMYYSGRLSEATMALSMPVMAAQVQAHAVYRCARDAPLSINRDSIVGDIARLEKAVATLREALDLGKPELHLIAAE